MKTKLREKHSKIIKVNAELTDAEKSSGSKQLYRVGTIIDVLFALMIFRLFLFLPRPDVDHFGAAELVTVLKTSYLNYMVMGVGIIMILIYWNKSNLQFGNLERSDGRHASLSIVQVFCLFIYLYFVRLDVELGGAIIALKMESSFLALAGVLSIYIWHYSIKKNLLSDELSNEDKEKVYLKIMPEPIVAVLTFPFAHFGPDIWTLSWLLLIPVSYILKRTGHKLFKKSDLQNNSSIPESRT
jgi:hypothetical protein